MLNWPCLLRLLLAFFSDEMEDGLWGKYLQKQSTISLHCVKGINYQHNLSLSNQISISVICQSVVVRFLHYKVIISSLPISSSQFLVRCLSHTSVVRSSLLLKGRVPTYIIWNFFLEWNNLVSSPSLVCLLSNLFILGICPTLWEIILFVAILFVTQLAPASAIDSFFCWRLCSFHTELSLSSCLIRQG